MADILTPSPTCNILLERIDQVSAGELDANSLAMNVLEQLALIERTRTEIVSRLENYSGECLVLSSDKIDDIKASLDEYEDALKNTAAYLESGDAETGNNAVEGLTKVGFGGRLIFEGYTPEDAEMGPTGMPILNVLIKLCDDFAEGEIAKGAVLRTMISIVANSCLAAYDLESNQESDKYSRDILIGAYNNFSDAVFELDPLLDVGPEAARQQIEIIIEAGNYLKESIENYSVAMATRGPSKMAHTNLILNIASSWRNGDIAAEGFSAALNHFRTTVDDLWREVEALASLPNTCHEIEDEIVPCRKAFEKHFQAIELFEAAVSGEADKYEAAVALLTEAADELYASKEKFDKIGEQVDKVPCVRCGAPNDPGNRTCTSCGARMFNPNASASSSIDFQEGSGMQSEDCSSELVMTENLVILFEAVNKIAEGKISAEEYNEVLNWFGGLVEENLINMPPEPEVSTEGFNEEEVEQMRAVEERIANYRAEIDEGARAMLEALEHLRLYAEDNNSLNLVEGVRELRDASIVVQKAAKGVGELVQACRVQAGMDSEEAEGDGEYAE